MAAARRDCHGTAVVQVLAWRPSSVDHVTRVVCWPSDEPVVDAAMIVDKHTAQTDPALHNTLLSVIDSQVLPCVVAPATQSTCAAVDQ